MLDLASSELTSCLIAVQQKGDDSQECRQRVEAGLAVYADVAPRAGTCTLVVVGGAAGDIGPDLIAQWCAESGVAAVVLDEARRVGGCSETGKRHLTTDISVKAILASYLTPVMQNKSCYER